MAIEAGASALGLVSAMPSGPGVISEEQIAEIAATIPPPIASFLLTSQQSVQAIVAQQRRCRTNCIQLCDCGDVGITSRPEGCAARSFDYPGHSRDRARVGR